MAYNQCSTTWTEEDDPNISNSPGLHTLSSGLGSSGSVTATKMTTRSMMKTTASAMGPTATVSNSTVGGIHKLKRTLLPL